MAFSFVFPQVIVRWGVGHTLDRDPAAPLRPPCPHQGGSERKQGNGPAGSYMEEEGDQI